MGQGSGVHLRGRGRGGQKGRSTERPVRTIARPHTDRKGGSRERAGSQQEAQHKKGPFVLRPLPCVLSSMYGGGRGIRTLGDLSATTVFKTVAFVLSAIPPVPRGNAPPVFWILPG
jgi:hypothetical protein